MVNKANSKPFFDPAISKEQMVKIERNLAEGGVTRRCALAVLCLSAGELTMRTEEGTADALLDLVDEIDDYLRLREEEKKMLKSAQDRIVLAMQWVVDHPSEQRQKKPMIGLPFDIGRVH
jgi:hypothetical protein